MANEGSGDYPQSNVSGFHSACRYAHLTNDLGADWLDRLELMIVIEDQFPAVEITDDDVDQIEVVGDLIRHIRGAWVMRQDGAPIVEASLQ